MAAHVKKLDLSGERLVLGDNARPVYLAATVAAVIGLVAALILGWLSDASLRRFYFAYLTAFVFFLSIVLGALFMVLMQYLCRAAWSVSVRRIAESVAGLMPVMAILAVPLVLSVVMLKGTVYSWALPLSQSTPAAREAAAHGDAEAEEATPEVVSPTSNHSDKVSVEPKLMLDAVTLQKRAWLNPWFFVVRVVLYFAFWSIVATWYRRNSIRQDQTGDPELTRKMQIMSGICVVLLGLSLTGAAGDFIMSLDPHWFSTMFGIYYFVGGALANWAVLILAAYFLQRAGYLTRSVTREHYHDLGKFLFGFTFLWGYIAFSQYMLLWYANIPEEIAWFSRHGATTVPRNESGWSAVIIALLFGQLLIPFAGLLSRHVKRRLGVLVFWAVWVLTFHLLDTYWMVMPEYHRPGGPHYQPWTLVIDLAALIGMGGVLLAVMIRSMAPHNLRPVADPRLPECLAFQNV